MNSPEEVPRPLLAILWNEQDGPLEDLSRAQQSVLRMVKPEWAVRRERVVSFVAVVEVLVGVKARNWKESGRQTESLEVVVQKEGANDERRSLFEFPPHEPRRTSSSRFQRYWLLVLFSCTARVGMPDLCGPIKEEIFDIPGYSLRVSLGPFEFLPFS